MSTASSPKPCAPIHPGAHYSTIIAAGFCRGSLSMVMDAQRAVRRRIETARNIEMAEHLAARLRAQLDEFIAATADIPLPPVREMILEALRYAAPIGLSRNE